jgi:hypothetical protein
MALFDRKMHSPVHGTARVVDNDGLNSLPGQAVHCPLDLMVEADGVPAYLVHITVRPKTGKWPEVNQLLPVVFDRSDPTRVEILWDQVPSLQDRVQLRKEARLQAAQQATTSGSGSAAPTGDGSPQDLVRQALADPAAFAERMRAQGMASAQVPWSTHAAGAPGASTPVDPMDRIARIADLRDRGALTESEFQAQKERILAD